MQFWKSIDVARRLIKDGDSVAAQEILESADELAKECPYNARKKMAFLESFKFLYELEANAIESNLPAVSSVNSENNIDLDQLVEQVATGTSLVTCCMNRNENLVKALPSWIACSDINEIVIVDWSSTEPVFDYLKAHGIEDERIKVVRVNDQSRWILSYAFNVGFRAASYDKILKTDADIIVYPDFFNKNQLSKKAFIAGDWRIAEAGQEHINGFFYVHREDLLAIKGFNEYITTYGWDDDDIYHRLTEAGTRRKPVDVKTIYHIPHDDALRVGNLGKPKDEINYLDELHNTPRFKIFTNKHIAHIMPVWNKDRYFLPFTIIKNTPQYICVEQSGESIHYVPQHIRDQAEYLSELELTSWTCGLRTYDLNKEALRGLLHKKPLQQLTQLDIEVANYNANTLGFDYSDNYVVVSFHPDEIKRDSKAIAHFLNGLRNKLNVLDYGVVIQSDAYRDVEVVTNVCEGLAFVPGWRNVGDLPTVKISELSPKALLDTGQSIRIETASIDLQSSSYPILQKITLDPNRDKFYIDAQHGLGNRLRAIGSAAAIAQATGKQLVIVWEPDHHCECRFVDLFDYDGEVIEKSFVDKAREVGDLFNYMEIEEGSEKDKPIKVSPTKYTYARAAYTLVHEASHWEAENAFIKQLKPSKQVLDLIEQFNVDGYIAAHIRMEAGKGLDNNTYDSVENWTQEGHDQLHYWREKSHYSAFIKRIDQLIEEDRDLKLFIATDLQETYDIFQQYYGDRLVYLKRNVFDRSKEQIIFAMADVLLLSKCKKLLGSTWSSFSEAAMRLSDTYSEIEMSGRDF